MMFCCSSTTALKKAITILRCRGCYLLIFGTVYSCIECFFNSADHRFVLCNDCYAKGNVPHVHDLTFLTSSSSSSSSSSSLHDQALLIKFSDLISDHPSTPPPKEELKKMWEEAKSQVGAASPEVEEMADNYFKSMGANNSVDIKKFSSTFTKQQQEFLTPSPDSDPATNYMKIAFAMAHTQTPETASAYHTASPSTPQTYYPNPYYPNHQIRHTSSNAISPMKVVKAVTTTFEIVEMFNTIATLSSLCTIM